MHLAINENLTAIGFVKSIRDTHRSGFSRAVLANNGVDRTRFDLDTNLVVGENVAEPLAYVS